MKLLQGVEQTGTQGGGVQLLRSSVDTGTIGQRAQLGVTQGEAQAKAQDVAATNSDIATRNQALQSAGEHFQDMLNKIDAHGVAQKKAELTLSIAEKHDKLEADWTSKNRYDPKNWDKYQADLNQVKADVQKEIDDNTGIFKTFNKDQRQEITNEILAQHQHKFGEEKIKQTQYTVEQKVKNITLTAQTLANRSSTDLDNSDKYLNQAFGSLDTLKDALGEDEVERQKVELAGKAMQGYIETLRATELNKYDQNDFANRAAVLENFDALLSQKDFLNTAIDNMQLSPASKELMKNITFSTQKEADIKADAAGIEYRFNAAQEAIKNQQAAAADQANYLRTVEAQNNEYNKTEIGIASKIADGDYNKAYIEATGQLYKGDPVADAANIYGKDANSILAGGGYVPVISSEKMDTYKQIKANMSGEHSDTTAYIDQIKNVLPAATDPKRQHEINQLYAEGMINKPTYWALNNKYPTLTNREALQFYDAGIKETKYTGAFIAQVLLEKTKDPATQAALKAIIGNPERENTLLAITAGAQNTGALSATSISIKSPADIQQVLNVDKHSAKILGYIGDISQIKTATPTKAQIAAEAVDNLKQTAKNRITGNTTPPPAVAPPGPPAAPPEKPLSEKLLDKLDEANKKPATPPPAVAPSGPPKKPTQAELLANPKF